MSSFSSLVNSLHVDESTTTSSRFSSAAWFRYVRSTNILIAGVGGIGSWLALMLARLQPGSITLVDNDRFEPENMAGQLIRSADVGSLKVDAVQTIMNNWANYRQTRTICDRINGTTQGLPAIVFGGFDNMQARRDLYESWKATALARNKSDKTLFIDGRLAAETLQVFCFTGADEAYRKEYERKWLFSDTEAESTVCSYKQTSYCANLIASIMTNLFVNWCTNQCDPLIERSVPFMTEYQAEQMYFKCEV